MKILFLAVLGMCMCIPVFAENSEYAFEAALNQGDHEKANQIFLHWAASDEDEKVRLAEKYLL